MSTRAVIKIEGLKFAKIYKHSDGYPEGMLHWLEEFNQSFAELRGDDPMYKFAQILRHSTKDFPIDTPDNSEYYKEGHEFLGWGVTEYNSKCGEEFVYILKKDGTVTVRKNIIVELN